MTINSHEKYTKQEGKKDHTDEGVTLREFCAMRKSGRHQNRVQQDDELHELFKIDDWTKLRKVKFTNENLAEKISQIKLSQCCRPLTRASETHVQGVISLAEKYKKEGIAPCCSQEEFTIDQLMTIDNYKGLQNFSTEINWNYLFRLF